MSAITAQSTVEEVAAIVSDALERAGIMATLSGGSAVTIYSINEYLSRDLDFVTSAMIADLKPVLESLGFEHTGIPRLSQFTHPKVQWYVEFPPAYAWKDAQSRDQAIMVAANQDIDWEILRDWFANEGESDDEWQRFKDAVGARKSGRADR